MNALTRAPRVVLSPILSLAALPGLVLIGAGLAWVWAFVRMRQWVEP